MSAEVVELVLAKLYTDDQLRELFLQDPLLVLNQFKLSADEKLALKEIDRAGLVMASASIKSKSFKKSNKKCISN